ncbi:MAG: FadR/GntR family transcriptional regulator [Ostreibacterium sp.]
MTQHAIGQPNVSYQTKKEVLARQIIERIVTGLLRDKDLLPGERELSKLFEVSRETVRGALTIIADYGLITITQGSKTRVNASEKILSNFKKHHLNLIDFNIDIDVNKIDIDDVFETRMAIEQAIIKKAVANITEEQLLHLQELVHLQHALYEDAASFQLSDRYFHQLLARYSNNELLQKYSKHLYNCALTVRRQVLSNPKSIQRSVYEHKQIVDKLSERDCEGAVNAIIQHLTSVHQTTKAIYARRQD